MIAWNLFKHFFCNYFIFNKKNLLEKEIGGILGISFQKF
jgi:hypothetical protein